MGVKKKCPEGPNNAYLVSFGDTMTALLAFFIVLNSLAEEQTGAALHAGTGSFVQNLQRFGLPGKLNEDRSAQGFQLDHTSPKYLVPDPDPNAEPEKNGTGPDDVTEGRVIDRQKEDFHRFLQEVRRINEVKQVSDVVGEVSFDVMKKMPPNVPLMTEELKAALNGVSPMLRRDDYEVGITVWATTPSKSAWSRALTQAQQLHTEAVQYLQLPPGQHARITASAQPWMLSDVKRPSVSVKVQRLKSPGP